MKKITLLTFLLLGTVLSSYAQTFNSTTGAIPDNSCTVAHEFPFTVTGVGVIGTASSFDQIVINITHTYDSDLNIRLTAPTGEFVELSTNNGGSGDNYVNTVFRADATASITTGIAPFTGVYLPEGSFNAFNGVNADGTWILRICDQALQDIGTLNSSAMTFVPITPEMPDYVNLQSPATATTTVGGPDVTIYAQVYEAGLTDVAPNIVGQAPGITAWIGYSTMDTNPDTWTNWIPATWNAASTINPNNDEYQIGLGATLPIGTYYYASRFKLNAGVYVYGGVGNFWNGTTSPSGVLTVTPIVNDDFANASTITCGNVYTGNTTNATLDEDSAPDGFGADMDARNVWYKYTGTGAAETVTLNLCGSGYDTSVLVYTGTSGSLTLVAANDDDNTCTSNGLNSKVNFNSDGTTTYYIAIEGYNVGSYGAYTMNVTCATVNPPAVTNQDCDTSLLVNVDGVDVNSDNSFGTVSSAQPTCDPFGAIQDVWFSFVAPTSGTVDCLVTNGTMTSSNFNIYSGPCTGLTAVGGTCNANLTTPTTESLTGLVSGDTYYVQVWSNSSEQGTFTLRLSDPGLATTTFNSTNFVAYPNPVKDMLNLAYSKNIDKVQVINLLGQEVVTKIISANQTQIDLSSLSSGAYLVKVTSDNQTKTIKIIKE